MIGVIANQSERPVAEEFFQLFKTPWEFWQHGRTYDVVIATTEEVPELDTRLLLVFGSRITNIDPRHEVTAGPRVRNAILDFDAGKVPTYGETLILSAISSVTRVSTEHGSAGLLLRSSDLQVLRLGYDLFQEIQYLLLVGQPIDNAQFPTIDIHIAMLREWIVDADVTLIEIPPTPSERSFIVCLTHDIDFAGIRQHKFDHTMWGFLYRSTAGALLSFARGRLSFGRMLASFRAAVSLPLVYLGLARDFWLPFDWYMRVEKNLPATYYLIPFKGRSGEKLNVAYPDRRACAYDIGEIAEWTSKLTREGYELGVHGIDAWHSVVLGKEELKRIQAIAGNSEIGIRMHWLLRDEDTYRALEDAGYAYDSTAGYNETAGYRNGTVQVFRPLGCEVLLELPMHIQDGALFFPKRLNLSESAAWELCESLIGNAKSFGGVLTILWHDRSHGPERFWGDYYTRLVHKLASLGVWFGTAAQIVAWFRKRREVRFRRVDTPNAGVSLEAYCPSGKIIPPLTVRVHRPRGFRDTRDESTASIRRFVDCPWSGDTDLELGPLLARVSGSVALSQSLPH